MALEEFYEVWDGRRTNFQPDFQRGTLLQLRDHTRTFQAETDGASMDPYAVITAALAWPGPGSALPAVGASHPSDPKATLTHYDVEQFQPADTAEFHRITCHYKIRQSPIDDPAVLEWGSGSVEFIIEGAQAFVRPDLSEQLPTALPYPGLPPGSLYPITNSALDPFEPHPSQPEYYRVLTVTKNFRVKDCSDTDTGTGTGTGTKADGPVTPTRGWDAQLVDQMYSRRVNSLKFRTPDACIPWPAGTVLLAEPPTATEDFSPIPGVGRYFKTRWVFWIRARGWDLRLADMGFRRNAEEGIAGNVSGLQPVPIYRGSGPAQNPCKLNGFGDEAEIGDPLVFLRYRIFQTCDFEELQLFQGLV